MQAKWQNYWAVFWKKTRTSFVILMPGFIVFFTFLDYAVGAGKVPLSDLFVVCTAYSVGISVSMHLVYSTYWAVVTAFGERAVNAAQRRLVPSFFLSFIGLGLGILAAIHALAWIRHEPAEINVALYETFLIGAAMSVAFIFWEAYRTSRAEARELAAKTVEAQYTTLKNQMQPHFLFNSLNSLSELIAENPDQASVMTEKLASLYRSILANSKEKTSSLASELAIVRAYLDLEGLRFGKRLRYTIDEPNGAGSLYLPSLMLQTLVENAVKYGVSPAVAGGEVKIKLEPSADGMHRLTVRNSGSPLTPDPNSSGTGLQNTRKRLELLYGDKHGFQIRPNGHGETEVSFNFSGDHIV